MDWYTYVIEDKNIGKRIDLFLSEELKDVSRSFIQKLIKNKNVKVNQNYVKANYKLKLNDVIDVKIPEPEILEINPEPIELDILYEDKDIIVVNKPQGMVVHPAPGHYSGTLVNALLYHCSDDLSGINGILRPGIVHRIDKDTSGVLMVAKNDLAHQNLTLQLKEHTITRKYNAIVYNNIIKDFGTINAPIGRHPIDRKKMAVTNKNSRQAITHYTVLERFGQFTFIEAQLETGRTHQIRVHMKYIGHPLLGDPVYGPKSQPFNLNGQLLHARVLGFKHPSNNKYMEFEAPLPDYFKNIIEKLRKKSN
ncbi:RluA family pseudouridine synthase [Defluviitalea phaphyphila]|uniref:RluA family pseudouridine synthase n=1 Tax=Defluviitalea phaphyphila TaxID=1473580 RepID=UPI0007318116|nr:RluA family pseudouridine synthase [Defluviitalea phaphyphila]